MAERKPRQRGVALLVTLLATALLTVTIMQMTYSTQILYRRTAHWLAAKQARLAAESGVALAAELLAFDGELAELVAEAGIPPQLDALAGGLDPRLAAIDGLTDFWARCSEVRVEACGEPVEETCSLPLDLERTGSDRGSATRGFVTVRIDDETGLYNLNRPFNHPLQSEYERLGRLLAFAGVDASLAGPIVDWIDADTAPLAFPPGAEASRYGFEALDPPPRNAPLATFRELGLVLGVRAGDLVALRRLAAVLPAPVAAINVNTAPPDVLRALAPDIEASGLLATLEAERCRRPFVDAADLTARVAGIGEIGIVPLLTFSSQWFRVRTTARVGDVTQSVEALLFREGATVNAVYILNERGANIRTVDTPPVTGFGKQSAIVRFSRQAV